MRLSFKTKYPFNPKQETEFESKIKEGMKIHTLREDPKRRWRAGVDIEMVNGSRYKPNVFNTEHRCSSVQEVQLSIFRDYKGIGEPVNADFSLQIEVDGRKLNRDEIRVFIFNDGFYTLDSFLRWFFKDDISYVSLNEPIKLRCIHWTDLKY